MKTAGAIKIFLLMISLLLVAITASGAVGGKSEAVLDTHGRPVESSVPYIIEAQTPKGKAWISEYGSNVSDPYSCPQRVVSVSDETEEGPLPVYFGLSYDRDVTVSTELRINFEFRTECGESGYWRVANSSSPTKEIVLSGSESSNDSIFTVMKSDNGSYKFAFGSADKPTDIGLDEIRSGIWRLILSNNSGFGVSFVPYSKYVRNGRLGKLESL